MEVISVYPWGYVAEQAQSLMAPCLLAQVTRSVS